MWGRYWDAALKHLPGQHDQKTHGHRHVRVQVYAPPKTPGDRLRQLREYAYGLGIRDPWFIGYATTPNAEDPRTLGAYDPNRDSITFYPVLFEAANGENEVRGIVAHELSHYRFERLVRAYFIDHDPTVRARLAPYFEDPDTIRDLIKKDGITQYSLKYWLQLVNGSKEEPVFWANLITAYDETLAEMARYRTIEGGPSSLPRHQPWNGFYEDLMELSDPLIQPRRKSP